MALVTCIFCNTTTDGVLSAGYCDGCGRKLPTSARHQTKRGMARTLEEDPTQAAGKGGPRETFLLAAIAHLFGGGLFLVGGSALFPTLPEYFLSRVMKWTLIPTLFVGSLMLVANRFPRASLGIAVLASYAWVGATFFRDVDFATRWLPVQGILLVILHYALYMSFRPAR